MHTVDTSLELNLPVASYFPDDRTEAFSGNELIISKGGYKITKHSDLNAFLEFV